MFECNNTADEGVTCGFDALCNYIQTGVNCDQSAPIWADDACPGGGSGLRYCYLLTSSQCPTDYPS